MTQAWTTPVEADQIVEGRSYFLAFRPMNSMQSYSLYGSDIKGRRVITCKPGIADRFEGNDKLRGILLKHPDHVALEVPADADKRWKRRQRRF